MITEAQFLVNFVITFTVLIPHDYYSSEHLYYSHITGKELECVTTFLSIFYLD